MEFTSWIWPKTGPHVGIYNKGRAGGLSYETTER